MYAEERQEAIAQLVASRRRVSVAALAQEFTVTTETVRRDLAALERLGVVRRVHGGAVPTSRRGQVETGLSERGEINIAQKRSIASAAAALLPPAGSTILVDAGSSTAALVEHLPADRPLRVLTHAVPLAGRLASLPHIELHLLPGRVRPETGAAVGAATVGAIAETYVDVAFVGTNGVTAERGCSTPDPEEAAAKRAIVTHARQVVVLADGSKVGEDSTSRFATWDQIDVLVTDAEADAEELALIAAHGVEVRSA